MLFVINDHIDQIINGTKTQTRRRDNGRWHMTPGKTYVASRKMYAKKDESVIIRCKRRWLEKLGDISINDAKAEGGYARTDYINGFCAMYRGMTPETVIRCYEFEFVEDRRP